MRKHNIIYLLMICSMIFMLAACQQSNDTNAVNNVDKDSNQSTSNTETNEKDETQVEQQEKPVEQEQDPVLPDASLQKGDSGDEVLALQKILIKIGYSITESSLFDQQTVWAITDLQLQAEDLQVTGIYDKETNDYLKQTLDDKVKITPGEGLAFQEDVTLDEDTVTLGNPYEILALVNKQHALPEDYKPSDLVIPDVRFPFVEDVPKKQMRKVAADAMAKMFHAADLESLDLFAQSGYRSYERQDVLFASYVAQNGEEEANTFSARPGESEHQSGLTMDVTSPHVNYDLTIDFGDTEEGIWLQEHAKEYGFIIRYPKGKEDITGYQYEPWHLRYVGVKAATEIMDRGITLEEYLAEILPD